MTLGRCPLSIFCSRGTAPRLSAPFMDVFPLLMDVSPPFMEGAAPFMDVGRIRLWIDSANGCMPCIPPVYMHTPRL